MSLKNTVNDLSRRYNTQKAVKRLLVENKDILESVKWNGLMPPRIYLIGEYHFEGSHSQFAIDMIKTVSPDAFFWEGATSIIKPSRVITRFDDFLEKADLQDYRQQLIDIIPTIPTIAEDIFHLIGSRDELEPFLKSPELLLTTYTYKLDHNSFDLFIKAFSEIMAKEFSGLKSDLEAELRERETAEKWDSERIEYLMNVNAFLRDPFMAGIQTLCEWAGKEYSSTFFHGRLKKLIDFYVGLEQEKHRLFMDIGVNHSGKEKLRYNFEIYDTCSLSNTTIYPFDDEEARDEFLRMLNEAREKEPEAYKMGLIGEEYARRTEEQNKIRENRMKGNLADYLNASNDTVITRGGGLHLRDDSPVVLILKENKIPYCRIILKSEDTIDNQVKGILYAKNLLKNG